MEMTKESNDISPFDEDRHYQSQTKGRKIVPPLQQQQQVVSTPQSSSSSSNTMAANLGSSISDLGQSLFHNLDKVSSRLVGEATASFFADQSVGDGLAGESSPHRLAIPPPGLPMLRVMTEASTFTDDDGRDSDLESVDDDKTVRADNKAATWQERRIAHLREDKRRLEWTREEISPRKGEGAGAGEGRDNDMPSISPSILSVTPPRQARYRNRRAKTVLKERNVDLDSSNVLPQIPELRKANNMTDVPICDDDIEQNTKDGNDNGGLCSLAFVPLEMTENKKSVLADSSEENAKSEETKSTPAVAKEAVAIARSEECTSSNSDDPSASTSDDGQKRKKRRRLSLSKLTLAAMILIVFGLVLILTSVLRRSRANSLRGSVSSDVLSTSSSSGGTNPSSSPTQTLYEPTVVAADLPDKEVPTASPSTREPTASPSKAYYPTAPPTSSPTSMPRESQVESLEASQERPTNIFEINDDDSGDESFSFYVIGRNPKLMRAELKNIEDGEFFVHLGDVFSAKDQDCDEKAYDTAADLLRKAHLPVLVIPGDEDWIDCRNVKPKRALQLWRKSFIDIEKNWKGKSNLPGLVQRSEDYPENFAFMFRGALFVGIGNVDDDDDEDESKMREKETKIFIRSQVKTFESDPSLRSIVVFTHEYDSNDIFGWISQRLGEKNVQVVHIHADKSSSPNGSFLDVPIDDALPTKLTISNGKLLTR